MNKNKILYITAVALLLGLIFGVVSKRLDLTQEKRYTLTEATIKTLKSSRVRPSRHLGSTFTVSGPLRRGCILTLRGISMFRAEKRFASM